MGRRRTLNERRLTRREVEELITSGAEPRADLTAALNETVLQSRVYELPGDRFLLVFGDVSGLAGKGDIYAGDDFRRFVHWSAKVDEDAKHGRQGSTDHWAFYSTLKDRLISGIDAGNQPVLQRRIEGPMIGGTLASMLCVFVDLRAPVHKSAKIVSRIDVALSGQSGNVAEHQQETVARELVHARL